MTVLYVLMLYLPITDVHVYGIYNEFEEYHRKNDSKDISKSLLHFGEIWRGRADGGKILKGEFDVLSMLASSHVSLWKYNLSAARELIGAVAMAQYREHRDSMKV